MTRKNIVHVRMAAILAAALSIALPPPPVPPRSAARRLISMEPIPTARPKAWINTAASSWCWSGITTIAPTP